jgi:HK97 family phage prohead protease
MHDPSEPVGDWLDMSEDAQGLYSEGQLWVGDSETPASRKAANVLRGTGPKGLSIGYKTKRFSFDQKSGVRSLEDVDIKEVSVVGYGMNPKAVVTHIKSLFDDGLVPTVRDVEDLLRDAGFSSAQAKAFIASGWKGVERDAGNQRSMADEIAELLRLRAALRQDE